MRSTVKNIDIESERLTYKRVSSEHISEDYVSWINDSEVNRYLETRGNYTLDLLKSYIEQQYNKATFFWAIHLKDSNKHIGNIKIDPINFETKSGEYGILIGDKSNWGKGYASEATIRIINYCFDELELTKITLGVIEDNVSAVNLYKKLGFKIDEVIQGTKVYNNKISNSLRMSIHA
ncbi:GNAT family N-acetyltransferase [Paucihalobacter ruber]|uniref:GNAT family N-acetyltransferase n=1 Tax=Paucihalobacter ruber TaxID=2567861 RepID=A0A506PRZ9_9FLAO|nr:GNAT family N-acetyltransferase [Paucihalobacter ruber]